MKEKFTLLTLIVLTSSGGSFAQLHLDWAFSTGSLASDHTGSLKHDAQDNLYVLSEYKDTLDLDPGPGVDIAFPTSSPVLALSKFNGDGEYQWSGLFWDEEEVYGRIYEVLNNRLRLMLTFTNKLIFQLPPGQNPLGTLAPGKHSCFIDLTPEGEMLNMHFFESPNEFYLTDIITLPNGNMLVGGSYMNTFSFSGPADQITALGGYDVLIAMLDPSFEPIWTRSFGSAMDDYISRICYHSNGTLFFAFEHEGQVMLETLEGPLTFPSNGNYNNVFGYMDLTGSVEKAFALSGDQDEDLRDITSDSDGNMYICGSFEGTVNFAHPSQAPVIHTANFDSDGFVAKYDPNGLLIWERIYRNGDYGGVYTIALKRGTELYLTGGLTGRSDLDPGPDSLIVEGDMRSDIFVSKLTLDGDLEYSYHFPGNDVEGIRNLIVSTGSSRVFLHGFFYDSLDCDFTAAEYWLAAPGGADIFMMGFSEDNVISTVLNATDAALRVYPNPTSGIAYIDSEEPVREVMIVSTDGRIVSHLYSEGDNFQKIDLTELSSGIYVIRTVADNGQRVSRILRY